MSTGNPSCIAGCHRRDVDLMTLIASSIKSSSGFPVVSKFSISPIEFTTNITCTIPCLRAFNDSTGYFIWVSINIHSRFSPPMNFAGFGMSEYLSCLSSAGIVRFLWFFFSSVYKLLKVRGISIFTKDYMRTIFFAERIK